MISVRLKENPPWLADDYPVSWNHEYQGGRVWYTNMGHYAENFHQQEFIQHVVDWIAWLLVGGHLSLDDRFKVFE